MTDPREWLETDGLGGYAMGTADGIRRRRYHGLLVAAVRPPTGRMVLVADLEVFAETAAGSVALSSHRYRDGVIHPDGATRIAAFSASPWPRREHAIGDGAIVVEEWLIAPGAPCVVVRWTRRRGDGPLRLRVRPLLAARDHHATHHENPGFDFAAEVAGLRVSWRPYPGVPAIVAQSNGGYRHAPAWFRRSVLAEEAARGLDAEEDLASPGELDFDLAAGPAVLAFAADGAGLDGDLEHRFTDEATRRATFATPLHRAADAYVVTRGDGRTVIAGYPWFADWGRDTFISLRGLALAAGRVDVARGLVLAWASALSRGMLPNRFHDSTEPGAGAEYNAVDASLWFVIAADALLAVAGACDAAERRTIEDAIDAIVAGYAAGTRHRIGVADDGLLACGEPGVQLTWMDAKVGDWVVTPRTGKPVEIQALWASALAIAGRRAPRWLELLARTRAAFAARFWNPARELLFDVVDCDHRAGVDDPTFRPNQIFAVGGLPLALLDGARARAVVDAVERALWTPAGLRSLAPVEPGYQPHYRGGPVERDGAYHQGPVWTWLAGPFVEAWVRVRGDTAAARAEARVRFLDPLLARLHGTSIGHLAELADAEPPHTATGCPFQAWSIAEALRLDRVVLAVANQVGAPRT